MVGACRCGANKFDSLAGEQRFVNFGDGSHHQRISVIERFDRNGTTRNGLHFPRAAKKLARIGHIFINEDFHGSVPV